jgi:hypothetical protein
MVMMINPITMDSLTKEWWEIRRAKILEIRKDFCFSARPHILKFNLNPNTSRDEMASYPFVIKL